MPALISIQIESWLPSGRWGHCKRHFLSDSAALPAESLFKSNGTTDGHDLAQISVQTLVIRVDGEQWPYL